MIINKLRHRITIEENVGDANDGGGNDIAAWEPKTTIWANVRPLRAEELVIAEKTGQRLTHLITIRYRTDILHDKHRFNFMGRLFVIESIINKDEMGQVLEITCREGIGDEY